MRCPLWPYLHPAICKYIVSYLKNCLTLSGWQSSNVIARKTITSPYVYRRIILIPRNRRKIQCREEYSAKDHLCMYVPCATYILVMLVSVNSGSSPRLSMRLEPASTLSHAVDMRERMPKWR
jgi:hypothetical protein